MKPKTAAAIVKGLILGAAMIAIAALTGCGGTFTLSPSGLSYTTPEILKAPIVRTK